MTGATITGAVAGQPLAALVGRLLIAAMFVVSGALKMLRPADTIARIRGAGLPFAAAGLVIAILIEMALNVPFVLGYALRPVTLVMVAYCLVAAAFFHNRWAKPEELIAFWSDMAIVGGLLLVFASAPA